jgi:hypothetical protein
MRVRPGAKPEQLGLEVERSGSEAEQPGVGERRRRWRSTDTPYPDPLELAFL